MNMKILVELLSKKGDILHPVRDKRDKDQKTGLSRQIRDSWQTPGTDLTHARFTPETMTARDNDMSVSLG